MSRLISMEDAIRAIEDEWDGCCSEYPATQIIYDTTEAIEKLPIIQPEPHEIGYDDCANALLKMWMDNVLTDGDYYRITDKLNKKWGKTELPEPYTEPYKGVTDGRD